ncbi:fumarylpyruvate hydrolase [Arboricoccus pini]|uniref:Fumarylpyruvate hydrolase n=1 Tax=Arboricoccus pini TaxID=1963835 RepID=A0A212RBN8_9PROT|nr:fumarylacetoacetate hydrolase family protein [Arboricoccus pini]SNB69630.1 fumarylpyruvate hydrolase [Arboricoccus pini]
MSFVFEPEPRVTLPIKGSGQLFPVRRVYCVGRNYAEHAREMGHDPDREPPFFFQKNPDNLLPIPDGETGNFPYPSKTEDVHHEIELALALKAGGTDIPVDQAMACVYGYAAAFDMTRRDLQGQAKKAGRPWEIGKAFEHSAPCTALVPAEEVGDIGDRRIWARVDGAIRQDGRTSAMIWNIPETIAYLSGLFELRAGDVILTGTPAGVGAVTRGQVLEGGVEGIGTLRLRVA